MKLKDLVEFASDTLETENVPDTVIIQGVDILLSTQAIFFFTILSPRGTVKQRWNSDLGLKMHFAKQHADVGIFCLPIPNRIKI